MSELGGKYGDGDGSPAFNEHDQYDDPGAMFHEDQKRGAHMSDMKRCPAETDPTLICEHGQIVHSPSEYDLRVGESRRLHTPCPVHSKCPTCDSSDPRKRGSKHPERWSADESTDRDCDDPFHDPAPPPEKPSADLRPPNCGATSDDNRPCVLPVGHVGRHVHDPAPASTEDVLNGSTVRASRGDLAARLEEIREYAERHDITGVVDLMDQQVEAQISRGRGRN